MDSIAGDFPHLAAGLTALVADYDAYADRRKGFDDPEDLMRLLRGAGVLEFRIAVRDSDPQAVTPDQMRTVLRGQREAFGQMRRIIKLIEPAQPKKKAGVA